MEAETTKLPAPYAGRVKTRCTADDRSVTDAGKARASRHSPRTRSSTRRLRARPSSVSLSATGWDSPGRGLRDDRSRCRPLRGRRQRQGAPFGGGDCRRRFPWRRCDPRRRRASSAGRQAPWPLRRHGTRVRRSVALSKSNVTPRSTSFLSRSASGRARVAAPRALLLGRTGQPLTAAREPADHEQSRHPRQCRSRRATNRSGRR